MIAIGSLPFRPIVALQGASSAAIQTTLADFAACMKARGIRVAGVVEINGDCGDGACGRLALRDLATDAIIPISQDLGAGSTACNLDPRGLAEACAAVERTIARGVDLIVLSKFGKMEAARGGLIDAFGAALLAGVPIVTAVAPSMTQAWTDFAGDYAQFIDVAADSLDAWWSRVTAPAASVEAA